MTTKDEALKLALEGLEKWHFDKDPRGAADYIAAIHDALAEQPAPPPECKTDAEKTAFAFGWWKALEENRKQPAQDREPCGWRMKHNGEWAYSFTEDAWDFIRRVPKAQQQEPVAVYVGDTWCGSVVRLYEDLPLETPLYTSSQPSKPLTDEMDRQAAQIEDYSQRNLFITGWLHAEAAHGIKGDA